MPARADCRTSTSRFTTMSATLTTSSRPPLRSTRSMATSTIWCRDGYAQQQCTDDPRRMVEEPARPGTSDYNEAGMLEQRDEVNDVAEAVGKLHRLPKPDDGRGSLMLAIAEQYIDDYGSAREAIPPFVRRPDGATILPITSVATPARTPSLLPPRHSISHAMQSRS